MRAKVGDVIRITRPGGVSRLCQEFMRRHGDSLVVTWVQDEPDETVALLNYHLVSRSGEPMLWTGGRCDEDIPLFRDEYEIDSFLTAVRARRHA